MNDRQRSLIKIVTALGAMVLGLAGCGRDEKGTPVSRITSFVQGKFHSGPVLKVESADFTNADFRAYLRAMGTDETKNLPPESLSRLFDRFVDEKILLEAAKQRGITLTWDEKKNYLAKLAGESAGDEPAASDKAAPASPPDTLFDRLLVEKYTFQVIKDVRVEDREIEAYYNEHKKDFLLPERIQVSQILVPSEQKAVELLRKVQDASEEDFRRLARQESMGPEAIKGGMMGVYKPGELPNDMAKVIFALEEGKISQVVESSYGYHIFRLDKRFPPQLESETEVAPGIKVRVFEQKIKDALAVHLGGLKETLSWKVFPENLFFSYQRLDG